MNNHGKQPAWWGRLTPRQQQSVRLLWDGELRRINLFCGSVRSGKTWGSLWLWAMWAHQAAPPGAPLLMAGKTLATLRRNCLDILMEIAGPSNFRYNLHRREGVLYGRPVVLMGAADKRAEGKIRGATLGGAYLDELSLLPEDFFAMLLSRLSAPGARLFATTNPENPGHWLKRLYLDRAPKGPRVALPQGGETPEHGAAGGRGWLAQQTPEPTPSECEPTGEAGTAGVGVTHGERDRRCGVLSGAKQDGLSPATARREAPAGTDVMGWAPKGPRVALPQGGETPEPAPGDLRGNRGKEPLAWDQAGELDLRVEEFLLADNTFLDPTYVQALQNEYTGALYERFVLGRWVAAEGAVYPLFSNDRARFMCVAPRFDWVQVGVDFGGNQSAFAFVACGITRDFGLLSALASRRVPAMGVSPEDMYRHLEDFLAFVREKYGPVRVLYADSAEQTLINGLRRRLCVPVRNSLKRPILQRVRAVNLLLAQDRLVLTPDCESLAGALRDALYAPGTGRDERLDNGSTDIDSLDAFEYGFERYMGPLCGRGWLCREAAKHPSPRPANSE